MRKELNYFDIEGLYGGNQELFKDLRMRGGGCAAVTACDASVYCDLYMGTNLYPLDKDNLTRDTYEQFSSIMKPYISPRNHGVHRLYMYTEGFGKYLEDTGCTRITTEEFDGNEPTEKELIEREILGETHESLKAEGLKDSDKLLLVSNMVVRLAFHRLGKSIHGEEFAEAEAALVKIIEEQSKAAEE